MAFRYAIMGAAQIANKFCNAVSYIKDCEVVAVSSKSLERAKDFAERNNIKQYFDNYEKMLVEVKPDCVYIAVTQNAHKELADLCLKYKTPIHCEKAMFLTEADAVDFFGRAEKAGVFTMEAMWSRFLPAQVKAKEWIDSGKIGEVKFIKASIGWKGPNDMSNRFFNPALGGGAMYDLTVYCYELSDFLINKPVLDIKSQILKAPTGVDMVDSVTVLYDGAISQMSATFIFPMDETMTIYGTEGKIEIPKIHFAEEALLYDVNKKLVEHFIDTKTPNGFMYEAQEAMECVKKGKIMSDRVPHSLTINCAKFFDEILKQN